MRKCVANATYQNRYLNSTRLVLTNELMGLKDKVTAQIARFVQMHTGSIGLKKSLRRAVWCGSVQSVGTINAKVRQICIIWIRWKKTCMCQVCGHTRKRASQLRSRSAQCYVQIATERCTQEQRNVKSLIGVQQRCRILPTNSAYRMASLNKNL